MRVPFFEKVKLSSMVLGVIIKMFYAFLYQEKELGLSITGIFMHPVMIEIGAIGIPFVNNFADALTGFKQSDSAVNFSENIYPGHSFCKYD